jgi:hypothetical protein
MFAVLRASGVDSIRDSRKFKEDLETEKVEDVGCARGSFEI